MYGTVRPPSAVAQIDGWCIGKGVARLFSAAPVGILIDAEASTLRIGHVLADAAPEFAAAALGPLLNVTTSGRPGQSSITTWQSSQRCEAADSLKGEAHKTA